MNDIILVRVYECGPLMGNARIIISDGKQEYQSVDLKPLNNKNQEKNVQRIAETLNNIREMGYRLISSNASAPQSVYASMTDYVFQRERQQ